MLTSNFCSFNTSRRERRDSSNPTAFPGTRFPFHHPRGGSGELVIDVVSGLDPTRSAAWSMCGASTNTTIPKSQRPDRRDEKNRGAYQTRYCFHSVFVELIST